MYLLIFRRVLWSIPVLLSVSLITFLLMHIIPGGPWDANHSARPISVHTQDDLKKKYGLDQPIISQYVSYIAGVLRGDLGISYDDPRAVSQIIAHDFPLSAAFGLSALIISLVCGVPIGLLSALKRNSLLDRLGTVLTTISVATPNFVIGIVGIIVFAVNLHLVSVQFQRDSWKSWILPLFVLELRLFALVVRFVRTATLDTLASDYIRTAQMKGLPNRIIYYRHILRNALLPIFTLLGPLLADVLTGSFIVESIFGIPGIGRTFVSSITSRDYSLLMGVSLFFTVLLIFFNLLVDVSYYVIDPRISYH